MPAPRTQADDASVLDLFSGCGGLSLGFHTAGFHMLGGVDVDAAAAATHGRNFHDGAASHSVARSITTCPSRLLQQLGHDSSTRVDILVGGPPCQAFARVGRAKIRSESARRAGHADSRAWLDDPRATLYASYLAYVDTLKPSALLMENVPDVMNHGGTNIAEVICEELERHGYEVAYTLLNAAHFGVPQMRERMFLLAFRRELGISRITFPEATHHHELPRGYRGTRDCALRTVRQDAARGTDTVTHYRSLSIADPQLPVAVTASHALRGLPQIPAIALARSGELRRGPRKLDLALDYPSPVASTYERVMREWPGFESERVNAHVIRFLPRDFPIFRKMKPGDEYPMAVACAHRLLARALKKMPEVREGSAAYARLVAQFVPPYDPAKFPNKWRKMEADEPARTLMAHLGKDSYSHIHHDSKQARTISVREAARLQSFPDGFAFCGSMNSAFRQIGNAVPPLLAYALARHIRSLLGMHQEPDFRSRLGLTSNPGAKPARSRRAVAAC
jgi:DNA (cytosine-5)-methyltransferase 1